VVFEESALLLLECAAFVAVDEDDEDDRFEKVFVVCHLGAVVESPFSIIEL